MRPASRKHRPVDSASCTSPWKNYNQSEGATLNTMRTWTCELPAADATVSADKSRAFAMKQPLLLLSGLLCDETIWADIPERLGDAAGAPGGLFCWLFFLFFLRG